MSFIFNWIDVLLAIIIWRVLWAGLKSTIVDEIFRLFGILSAIFISLHYYVQFGVYMHELLFVPKGFQEFLGFALLWATVVVIFKIVGIGWKLILRIEAKPGVDKWGGFLLAAIRSVLICSLTITFLFTSNINLVGSSIHQSFSSIYFMDIAPSIYQKVFDLFIGRNFKEERLNVKVSGLRDLGKKSKQQDNNKSQ
jgi:uncharacterized membrane protein required for colicin V production